MSNLEQIFPNYKVMIPLYSERPDLPKMAIDFFYSVLKELKVDFTNINKVEEMTKLCVSNVRGCLYCFYTSTEELGISDFVSSKTSSADVRVFNAMGRKIIEILAKLDLKSRKEFLNPYYWRWMEGFQPDYMRFQKDRIKSMANIFQRMAIKKIPAQAAATTTGAIGTLQMAWFVATLPAGDALLVIGGGTTAGAVIVGTAIVTTTFIAFYTGTRYLIQNTKTGEKIDLAVTNASEAWFWKHLIKAQDVLAKKPPAEREKLQKKAQKSLEKLFEEMDAPATKSLIYANPPRKTSRKR